MCNLTLASRLDLVAAHCAHSQQSSPAAEAASLARQCALRLNSAETLPPLRRAALSEP